MNRKEEIQSAYRRLGSAHGFYDGMMTGTTQAGRWIDRHIWHMTREDLLEYQSGAFAVFVNIKVNQSLV